MVAVGIVGILAGLVGIVVARRLVTEIDTALSRSLALTAETLDALDASLALAEETVGLVNEGLSEAETTTRGLATTMDEGQQLLSSAADLTGTEVADSLEAVETSLPALVQVAATVDRALSALAALPLGVDYDPEEPFDQSVRQIQSSLDGLPQDLREQAVLIEDASANLGEVGRGTTAIADDLRAIDAGMAEALELLRGYSTTAGEARDLISQTEQDLAGQARVARWMVTALGVVIILGQIVPIYIGWTLLTDRELT